MIGLKCSFDRPRADRARQDATVTSRYNAFVITSGIREFMARDWRAVREAKDAYWGARVARLGPREGFRIADELRRQAILQDAGWPWPAERREDLLAHVRLSECFHRASSTRRS